MTRPLRTEVADGIHHAMSRGLNKQTIYRESIDYRSFLLELSDCVVRFKWRCLAYCLMNNHFHLLIQTPQANLGEGMRDLKSAYATTFNARYGRRGPLFEGRYRSQLVQTGDYLLAAARYIALNPVRAGLTIRPELYEWSSYRLLHAGESSRLFDDAALISQLEGRGREGFLRVVDDGLGLPTFDASTPFVGDRRFVTSHAPSLAPDQPVSRAAWDQARPPITELLSDLPRDEAIREARLTHRYTLREIAETVGCSTETIRRALRMWDVRT